MTTQYSECGNYKFEDGSLYSIGVLGNAWFHIGSYPNVDTVEDAMSEYFEE